jgi:hypothetical protein
MCDGDHMSTISEVFGELRNVFAKYIPWHSESEMTAALAKVDTAIKEAEDFEQAVIAAANPVVNTDGSTAAATTEGAEPADPTAATAALGSTAVAAAKETGSVTSMETSTTAPATDVPTAERTAVTDPYSSPAFPGSYTPPPVD